MNLSTSKRSHFFSKTHLTKNLPSSALILTSNNNTKDHALCHNMMDRTKVNNLMLFLNSKFNLSSLQNEKPKKKRKKSLPPLEQPPHLKKAIYGSTLSFQFPSSLHTQPRNFAQWKRKSKKSLFFTRSHVWILRRLNILNLGTTGEFSRVFDFRSIDLIKICTNWSGRRS